MNARFYLFSPLHLPFLGVFWGGKLIKHDLLACQMDGAGNGSLALIKAPRLAGSHIII